MINEPIWNQQSAAAYLLRIIEPADPLLFLAVQKFGYIPTASMLFHDQLPTPYDALQVRKKAYSLREFDNVIKLDQELLEHEEYYLITPEDKPWPQWLFHRFITRFDTRIASIKHMVTRPIIPPLALWIRTYLPSLDIIQGNNTIALVGTRASTSYGRQMSRICVHELAQLGYTIVSGGANGIDEVVHRAALNNKTTTIAVLAGGVDIPTPKSNQLLFSAITQHGMLVSEYPPGYVPMKYRFLVRNRIIAGISNAVVVVEAPLRSGALNTAWWSRKINCPLGAFPGPADESSSAGCHELIRENYAVLCTSGKHIAQLCSL